MAQGECEVAAGVVAVEAAGVSVGLPAHRPTRHVAVAGNLPVVGGLEEFFAFVRRVECANLRVRIEAHEVREVAVLLVGEFVVLPFRDAGLAAVGLGPKALVELVVQILDGRDLRGCEGRLAAKFFVRLKDFVEEFVRRLLRERRYVGVAVLGAPFVLNFVETLAVGGAKRLCVEGSIVHHGQGALEQVAVERVLIVTPEVRAVPCPERLDATVFPGGGAAEDVVFNGYCPARCAALDFLCQSLPGRIGGGGEVDDVFEERLVHLAEVGGVNGPVVHLDVDVGVYVAVPEVGVGAVVPDALQVAGRVDARVEVRADGQIAAVLEVETFEVEAVVGRLVGRGGVVVFHELLRGLVGAGGGDVERYAVHQFAVLGDVVGQERGIFLSGCGIDACLNLGGDLLCRFTRHAARLGAVVVRGGGHDEIDPCGVFHLNETLGSGNSCAGIGEYLELCVVLNRFHRTAEGGSALGIGHAARADLVVGIEGEFKRHLVRALGFVVGNEGLVGGGNEVAAFVGSGLVAALEVHAAHAVDNVEVAVIGLDGRGGIGQAERTAEVGNHD